MKNYGQPGNSLDLAAPANVLSGGPVLISSIFGVAVESKLLGETVAVQVEGVVTLPKLSANVIAAGVKLNYNTATGELQLATSTLNGVATAVEAAGAGVLTVKVKLTPV
jgi:predicted RecA/RadA family phage recombinase